MHQPPLQLQCTEKRPDENGELELYSVKFVLSLAGRLAHNKGGRQGNRSQRLDDYIPNYSLTDPQPSSPSDK